MNSGWLGATAIGILAVACGNDGEANSALGETSWPANTAQAGENSAPLLTQTSPSESQAIASPSVTSKTPPHMAENEPRIPSATEPCPKLTTGAVTVLGQRVQLWVGAKQPDTKAPVFFYWHGAGSFASEALQLGSALSEIQSQGGVVASFADSTRAGQNTGDDVWYSADFELADQILACAVEQLNIDTHRIYTGGCSAGGVQAGAMLYARSSYLAGAMPNSGGTVFPYALEASAHVPALVTAHGELGSDAAAIDFATSSATQTRDISAKGGFALDCGHRGAHCGAPEAVVAAQWQALKDHPFGIESEPYANGLPASFPGGCKLIK